MVFDMIVSIEHSFYFLEVNMTEYLRRIINFEASDWAIVQRVAREKGLGDKGYSATLRWIIREWANQNLLTPTGPVAPEPPSSTA